ncbi:MAG: hypothetical protein HQL30_06200 [Candidatus Omnitrophica bacterium]|nr:hypothetical protein [Candidatus Omnitrophota bacterium]
MDVVRRASRRKDIDPQDFEKIKDNVLEKGKDAKEAALEMNKYIQKDIKEVPEVDQKQQKMKRVKRFVGLLKSVRKEVMDLDILPKKLIKDMDKVLSDLEEQLGAGRGEGE